MQERILGLVKFGAREHMEELVRAGHLYMRPLSAFISMESDPLRADKDEGLAHAQAAEGRRVFYELEGRWTEVGTISGAIRFRDRKLPRSNVFCMHALLGSRLEALTGPTIDPRNLSFGDSYVFFVDGNEFLRRVRDEVARRKLEFQGHLVEYVNHSTYRGPMGVFRKFSSFSYQSEYRLAILPGIGEPYSLCLGDLSDIASVGSLSEIERRIRVVREDA